MSTTSWYRRSIWNYKGSREYTKSGYEYSRTKFVEEDLDIDCSDRHYVITGCNSGIGYEIALAVAKRGGILHMVCRNEDSAKAARSDIITTTGNDKIYLHLVDLARPKAVTEWAAKFAVQQEHIHVLVNNAGCLLHERRFDEDGCEIDVNFAVNTLAPYILTITLLPVLQRNEDARVINISSAGMLCVRLEPDDLMHSGIDPYDGLLVYSQNKRQQVVMSLWFAQRYDKVHFSCMHPGWVDTPGVRNSLPQFYEEMKANLRSPAEGADTAVWLAVSKAALKHPSGLFFQDRMPVATHLPLAWTKSSIEEENLLMINIEALRVKVLGTLMMTANAGNPDLAETRETSLTEPMETLEKAADEKLAFKNPFPDEPLADTSSARKEVLFAPVISETSVLEAASPPPKAASPPPKAASPPPKAASPPPKEASLPEEPRGPAESKDEQVEESLAKSELQVKEVFVPAEPEIECVLDAVPLESSSNTECTATVKTQVQGIDLQPSEVDLEKSST
ncbi:dehydrogenase/reductase SDR family member 12 isoform X1 [Procambarus clarkii]|uniref:dehydrogenase/reductase SDR family member 12 isoform X1 n=2 Tax=Procambarus clarkii TaxID=6728 RepID=UPI0037447AF7